MVNRVQLDDLYYSDAHIYELNGKPYSGVAEELFPNGNQRSVSPILDGKPHGETISLFNSGRRESSCSYVYGVAHGKSMEWFENGRIKEEREVEFGILMHSKTYDESGTLVEEYVRQEDDNMMNFIRKQRALAQQ